MRQRVLLLNTVISDLLGVESDRLHQKFGQDLQLVGCPNAESLEGHIQNLEVTRVDAVYIPKHALDRVPRTRLESFFAESVETVPHYAYAPVDDAHNALMFVTKSSDGQIAYDLVDL